MFLNANDKRTTACVCVCVLNVCVCVCVCTHENVRVPMQVRVRVRRHTNSTQILTRISHSLHLVPIRKVSADRAVVDRCADCEFSDGVHVICDPQESDCCYRPEP